MELGEVVNPNYAVPVVGVILCALLVFAFGFKSSVQPSFDFEDDRKSNKKRKPKKTQQGNGHISSSIDTEEKKPKPVAQIKTQVKTSPKVQQQKQKKPETVQKEEKESKKIQNNAESVDNDDEGEWTTQISRKLKKQKQKQEETKEQISPVEEKTITADIASDKSAAKKNEPNAEIHEKIEHNEAKPTGKSSDKKEVKPEKTTDENEKENKQVIDSAAVKKDDDEEASPKEKRSPRKKTKKKDVGNELDVKITVLEENTIKTKPDSETVNRSAESDQPKGESLKNATSNKKSVKAEPEPHIIEPVEEKPESPGNTQSKKKKKSSLKQHQKSSNSGEDNEVRSSPSHTPKNTQKEPHNLLQDLQPPQVEKEHKRSTNEASRETSAATDSSQAVPAEELSDQWLEAKTPRKKKKARRDT